jgi:hypothetical protein
MAPSEATDSPEKATRDIPTRRRESEIFEVSKSRFRPYLSLELTGLSDTA